MPSDKPHVAAVRAALEHYGGSTGFHIPRLNFAEQVTAEYAPLVKAAQDILDTSVSDEEGHMYLYQTRGERDALRAALRGVVGEESRAAD